MSDQHDMRLDLLLFTVGGVSFGVDAGQVAEIAAYDGVQADDLFWFHSVIEYGDVVPAYVSPTVITIRSGSTRTCRIIIDQMKDISGFHQNDISLFPALLEPFAIRRGLWGILSGSTTMVLLVDFQLLLRQKSF